MYLNAHITRGILHTIQLLVFSVFSINMMAQEKPNIIIINADDIGYGDLSCYGATKLKTPNIDQLAKEGRKFTDAHAASSVCTPSRYALLTGEYPFRKKGLSSPIFLKDTLVIGTQKATIASVLKSAGYNTACVGKWHLGFGNKKPVDWNKPLIPGPLELGFDYYFGVPVVNSHPPFVYVENHNVVGLTEEDPFVYGETAKTQRIEEKMHYNDIGGAEKSHALYIDEEVGTHIKNKALDWIKAQKKEKPFFLYLATTNIHHPFTPAPQFRNTSEAGIYGDFVHELDWIVGEVVKTIEEQGLTENTIIIFTSDNGGMLNATGQKAWKKGHKLNGDLLGFKFDAWEGGHRIPFIIKWPGKVPISSNSNQLICNVDILATFAEIVGVKLGDSNGKDSYNILPYFITNNKKQIRDELIISPFHQSHIALRKGKWLYINAPLNGGFNGSKLGDHAFGGVAVFSFTGQVNSDILDGKLKLNAPPAQLYNLEEDPNQCINLYKQKSEVVTNMKQTLKELLVSTRTVPIK